MMHRNILLMSCLLFVHNSVHATAKKEVLIFANGGFNSCGSSENFKKKNPYGMNIAPLTLKLAESLDEEKFSIRWIISCIGWGVPTSGKVRLVVSDAPDKLLKMEAERIPHLLYAYLKNKNAPMFMIGHSYGAWISMQAALTLGSKINLKGIYSIDPISPKYCKPYRVPLRFKGCHEAPRDLQDKNVDQVTNDWLNFYQEDDFWLSSGEMNKAENSHLEFSEDGHRHIASDVSVWRKVAKSIAFELSKI